MAGGRFTQDPGAIAVQLWVTTHGVTSLHLAGLLTLEEAVTTLRAMGPPLFVGFGDGVEEAHASVAAAAEGSSFPGISSAGSPPGT